MMEVTNRNRLQWRLFIFLFSTYTLFSFFFATAQNTQFNPRLSQLLDSAEIMKLKREFDQSIELCTNIMIEGKNIDDWESHARALNELSDIHRITRELEKAEKYLNAAHKIIRVHLQKGNIELARNMFYRGKLLRSKNSGNLESVKDSILYYYSRAEHLSENNGQFDYKFRSGLLFGIGYFHQNIGNTNAANDYYSELIHLLNTQFDDLSYRYGLYLFFVALHYSETGDYERSTILCQIASYILRQKETQDIKRYLGCEVQIANNFLDAQKHQEAVEQYAKVIDLLEKQYGAKNSVLIAPYINICQPLINLGEYDKAIEYSNQTIELIKNNPEYEEILYFIYNNLAEGYEKKGAYENAEREFRRTIDSRLELFGPHHEEVYEGYRYFGEYYERRGLYRNALLNYQKSLAALFKNFNPTTIYKNPDFKEYTNTEQLFYVLFGKSGALFKLFGESNELQDLKSSYDLYIIIYQLLDDLLTGDFLDKSSIQLFQNFEEGFNLSIDCAIRLYEFTSDSQYLDQSFHFMEKNKYFLLYKALMSSRVNSDLVGNNLTLTGRVLSMEIDELKQRITTKTNPDSLFNLRNQLIRKLDRKAILNKELVNNKDLSINSDQKTFNIKDAQNLISDKNEILIEYHWSNDHVYAFLIGKEIADIVKIEKTNELLTNIEKFANALSNHSIQKDDFKKYTASAYFLYDKLIKPIENRTSQYFGEEKIKRLIIVPDGPLSTLPFEAFISELDTSSNSYWRLDYLCRKYIVSYAYSLNILKNNLSRQKEIKNPKMLALSYSDKIDESSDIEQLRFENELPYSEEEIRRIRKRIKSTCYLGIDATEGIFKAKASAYSMVHLALHGQADTVDMFNSRLIFKKDSTSSEDGELRAYELYDMDLSELHMVVLSACETGIGKQYEGEGIFSIARGFAYAGCPSIVMSLWKVNDKATADLIDFFYANLKDKVPKDEALRNAKLAYIEKSDDLNAHPSNWAAFISLGNNQPIQMESPGIRWYFWVILAMIVLSALLIYQKRRLAK